MQLQRQRAEMILADQRVDVLLDVADKLLPRSQLVGSTQLPPGWQGGQQALRQQRHGTTLLQGGGWRGRQTGFESSGNSGSEYIFSVCVCVRVAVCFARLTEMMLVRRSCRWLLSSFMSLEFDAPASITNTLSLICRSTPNLEAKHNTTSFTKVFLFQKLNKFCQHQPEKT